MSEEWMIEIFVEEAGELVRRACTAAMTLESAPQGEREEPYGVILRDLHTLKGSAGSMNLPVGDHISHTVHDLEDLILKANGADGALTVIDDVISRLEYIDGLVARVAEGELIDATPADFGAPEPEPVPEPASLGHEVPGAEGFFLFDPIEPEVAPAPAPPAPAPAAAAHAPVAPAPAPVAPVAVAPVPVAAAAPARKPAPPPKAQTTSNAQPRELLRVRPERIDAAHEVASELMVSRLQTAAQTQEIIELRDQLMRTNLIFRALHGRMRENRRELGPLWAEVETSLGRLHNELSDLRQNASNLARRSTSLRDRSGALVASVEESIRTLRVMPIQPFLEELLPVVREAAKTVGRKARLVLDGGGSEADRHVLVGLREPMLHLVRNAVAHGIGSPERRAADGRDPVGTIWVHARCQGPRLRITIRDDGYGVDVSKVARRGADMGLVAPDARLDDSAVLSLLGQPGFSTNDEVDALSGRGVGMNVVLDAVERLGGRMELESNPGVGACFLVDVPIAAATTKGLVVVCGNAQFGLPLAHIERVVRVRADDLVGQEHPFVHIEGEPVAVAPLGGFVEQPIKPLGTQRRPAVVLQAHGARLALLVDDVPGESELVVKPMPAAFAQHPLVSGGAVQADSSVLLVLDLPGMVQQVQRKGVPCGVVREDQTLPTPVTRADDAMEAR